MTTTDEPTTLSEWIRTSALYVALPVVIAGAPEGYDAGVWSITKSNSSVVNDLGRFLYERYPSEAVVGLPRALIRAITQI